MRDDVIASLPSVFFIEDHYRNYPLVHIRLENGDLEGSKRSIQKEARREGDHL